MSQQTLEILSDELVEPSLLESEYPELIDSVGSIDSEDFLPVEYSLDSGDSFDLGYSLESGYFLEAENSIELENSLASKYSLDSGDSISFQEIEVDSLTGIPNDLTVYSKTKPPKRTTALRDPRLDIRTFSYNNNAEITATVKVELSPFVRFLVQEELVDITLHASIWGMDGGVFGDGNDHLFNLSDQLITGEGTYTFHTYVPRGWLNEDDRWYNRGDEIATEFRLTSSDPAVAGINLTAWSNYMYGSY